MFLGGVAFSDSGQKWTNFRLIIDIWLTDFSNQILFLKDFYSNIDVNCHANCEQKMPYCHYGRGPKGDQKAGHNRMANQFVKEPFMELPTRQLALSESLIYLPQAEQIEMIDHES